MVNSINNNQIGKYSTPEYTYFTPFKYETPDPVITGGVSKVGDQVSFSTKPNDSKAADGKDDGKIGFFSALGHVLKGGVKFVTGMFTDENGNFSLKQTLKTAAIGLAIGAATCIPVVGPFVIPALCAYGMVDGGCKVAKGFVNAMDAKTDAEAEKAWEEVGSGATEGILSYAGYKKVGGFSAAKEAASADLAALRGPKLPVETPKLPEPNVIDVEAVEVEPLQLEGPKVSAEPNIIDVEAVEVETVTPKVETNVPKHNEFTESMRREVINEQAAKVDAGQSLKPSNAEIVEQGQKLNTSHVNAKDAKVVEKAYRDIPTAEQQAVYDSEIAYQEPTTAQRQVLNEMAEQNSVKSAEAHRVENNIKSQEVDALAKLREQLAAAEASPKTVANGEYMLDGNRYVIQDGNIVEMQLKGAQKPQTKVRNIASHNAKSNVLERLANGEGTKQPLVA